MPQGGLLGGGQLRPVISTSGSMGGATEAEQKKWYQRPEIWEALQLGFNSMTLNPDPNLGRAVEGQRTRRSEAEQQEADRAQQAMTREQAVGFLRQNGAPDHLTQAVMQGLVPAEAAVQLMLQPPEDNRTALQQNFEYARGLGMPDDEARAWASSAPQTNVNVNTGAGEVGTIPPGFELMTDPETGARSMRAIEGGPAAQEAAAAAQAGERQQTLTARQINPTIDDIVTARDLAETGIGRTGMMSGILRRVPVLGQGALDLGETIDAIGAGISLENLNQMRQASPTGGALGTVSDRQSTLLSSAFGSLQQSQSKELFLYNLARVENTLNDIVHGPGNGPQRHDMTDLRRRYLGGREPEAQQQGGQQQQQGSQQPARQQIPQPAIDTLMQDPSAEAMREFDEVFGQGAAQRALGGR